MPGFIADENVVAGIAGSKFLAGVNHVGDTRAAEAPIALPWLSPPQASYLDYSCHIECYLDTGMTLHKPLPQTPQPVDSMASYFLGQSDQALVKVGENFKSLGSFQDISQRMATSEYRFGLIGHAIRLGYPVSVPDLKMVAGVVPTLMTQWVHGNELIGNSAGVPLYYNAWESWYFVVLPPKDRQLPPPNLSEIISAEQQVPDLIPVPVSPNDYNVSTQTPPRRTTGFTATQQ
jgi:hypothetical protein